MDEIVIIESPDGGKLVSLDGQLIWVSPSGSRTIIAGA